jgi:hypothetical protein
VAVVRGVLELELELELPDLLRPSQAVLLQLSLRVVVAQAPILQLLT